jgi:hypothetical protein
MATTVARRLVAFLDREALGVVVVAVFALFSLAVIPQMLVQDTWLTLVSGREISLHGLPEVDGLTVWARGSTWIDQQWLAQLLFFWTYELGGIKLVALAHVGAVVVAIASAIAAARSLGASSLAVSLVAAPAIFVAPWGFQARAQTFAIPLFVWLVWLLASDSRSPSRRVLLVFPLLVVWANLHGTVVLAAALVALRGVTLAVGGTRARKPVKEWLPRGLALMFGPVACLVASPYGLDLVTYYRTMLVNSTLRTFVDEWGPATPSPETFLFFVLAFVTVGLVARFGDRLTATERLILLLTLASGLLAIRNIIWFALAAVILVPALVDKVLVLPPLRWARLRAPAAALALGLASAAALVVAVVPASWYVREWPSAAGDQVVLAADPRARVLSDERYSDWLLWEHPELIGRIAYDVRFELFDRASLDRLYRYQNQIGSGSGRLVDDFEVVALDQRTRPWLVASLSSTSGFRVVHRDRRITVLERVAASERAEGVQVSVLTRH